MKQVKRQFKTFSFYDRTGIERHLERMAQRGWLLEEMKGFGWRFRRIEPKRLHFTVTYYPHASMYDSEPSEGERTFQDYCAQAGWHLAASTAQLQVFYHEGEQPVPIETDASLQVETIHKSVKRTFLPTYIMLLVVSLLNIALHLSRFFTDAIALLSSTGSLFALFSNAILFAMCVFELIGYCFWYRKARLVAELDGSFVTTRGHARAMLVLLFILLVGAAVWIASMRQRREFFAIMSSVLFLLLLAGALVSVRVALRRKKVDAAKSRALTVGATILLTIVMMAALVTSTIKAIQSGWMEDATQSYEYHGITWYVYHDDLPLVLEDFTQTNYQEYSYRLTREVSPFLEVLEAAQRPRMDALDQPDLEYTIINVKMPALEPLCRASMLREYADEDSVLMGYHLLAQDASAWRAQEVYRLYCKDEARNRYLIFSPNRIIELKLDEDPTKQQIERIAEMLTNAYIAR